MKTGDEVEVTMRGTVAEHYPNAARTRVTVGGGLDQLSFEYNPADRDITTRVTKAFVPDLRIGSVVKGNSLDAENDEISTDIFVLSFSSDGDGREEFVRVLVHPDQFPYNLAPAYFWQAYPHAVVVFEPTKA